MPQPDLIEPEAQSGSAHALTCPICGNGAYRKNGQSKQGIQLYQCKKCGRSFQASYQKAVPGSPLKQGLICPQCGKSDYSRAGRNRTTGKQQYCCNSCRRSFQESYRGVPPQTLTVKGLVCPQCGQSNYSNAGYDRDTGARRYQCKICRRQFQAEYKNKPKGIPVFDAHCPKCGSANCRKNGANRTQQQIYQCVGCEHSFIVNPKFVSAASVLPDNITPTQMYPLDYWDVKVLGVELQPGEQHFTLNFSQITLVWLKAAAKEWIKHRAAVDSVGTLRKKVHAILKFSRFLDGYAPGLQAPGLNRGVILDFLSYLQSRGLKSSSRNGVISHLKQFLEYCAGLGWAEIPTALLVLPEDYAQKERPLPRYIPQAVLEQLDAHIDALPEPVVRMVIVLRETGMRVSELCYLSFDCLRQDGQGTWWLTYRQFKRKADHSVPIRPDVAAIISQQQQYIRMTLGEKFMMLFCETEGKSWFQRRHGNKRGRLKPLALSHFSPISREISPYTLRGYLYELAHQKEIRDLDGQIFPLQHVHRFRHTKGTDLINHGVPIAQVKRFLGHDSFSMTMVYAHLHDQTLKQEMEQFWQGGKVVNIAGEVVSSPHIDLDTAEMHWFKQNVLAQVLPNGYCARPLLKGACPHANACLTCADFRTTKEFLAVHREELVRTEAVINKAQANGWGRQVEMNQRIKTNLENLIQSLEADNE